MSFRLSSTTLRISAAMFEILAASFRILSRGSRGLCLPHIVNAANVGVQMGPFIAAALFVIGLIRFTWLYRKISM